MIANRQTSSIVVFHDPGYPHISSEATLAKLIPGEFQITDAAHLASVLARGEAKLLLSFHGPYFPKQAWPAILRFLKEGGNVAMFGGIPSFCV
jgi:hypothetical protein